MSLPATQHMQAAATIAAGFPDLPADLAGKIDMIKLCRKAEQRVGHLVAILVARAREQYNDPSWWIRAMVDEFGWTKEHVHHLRQVGDLLWAMQAESVACNTLDQCSFNVLLAVARIPQAQVPKFLEGAKVAEMNRDEVRAAVSKFLGEAAKEKKQKLLPPPVQMDFMDELFSVSADKAAWHSRAAERLAKASVQEAWNGTCCAMEIVGVASGKLGREQLEQLGAALAQAAEQCKQQAKGRM